MDGEPHPDWNEALEDVIKKEGEQAEGLYWLHNQAAHWAQRWNDRIQIPAIVLATVTGFFSATSDMIPPLAIGAASVFVGILNTVNSYYKFSQRAEGHKIASLWYLKTYKRIETVLSLPIHQRVDAGALLGELSEGMTRITETAPQLPPHVLAAYSQRFAGEGVAQPLGTNGLDPIRVFRGSAGTPAVKPAAPPSAGAGSPRIKIGISV
jgi:hypothetical protein